MDDEDEEAGSISGGSRSCSPWPLPQETNQPGASAQMPTLGNFGQLRAGMCARRKMSTIDASEVDKSNFLAQRRGRPRRGHAGTGGEIPQAGTVRGRRRDTRPIGLRASAPFRAETQRGRLNVSDAPRGRLNALMTAARRRPLSKSRPGAPVLGARAEREPSLTRQRRHEAYNTMRDEPCEDTCYAYCLADRIQLKKLHDYSIKKRQEAVAAMAAAAVAAAAKAVARPRLASTDSSEGGAVTEASPQNAQSHEIQVVPLNKEVAMLKVGRKECFVFSFGCLVCWACTEEEAKCAKGYLLDCMVDPLPARDVDEDSLCIGSRNGWLPPEVPVSSHDPPPFERIVVAYALAQSVRLGSLEIRIERCIARTRPIPETMARTGQVDLTSNELGKMIGELFVLRNQVNLQTDILDTPDILWDYGDYEPLYLNCREHLDMEKRLSILNHRFEVLQDMFDALEDELNERQGTRLEWVVIVLCAVEAVVMGLRLYTRVFIGHSYSIGSGQAALLYPVLGPVGYIFHLFKTLLIGT